VNIFHFSSLHFYVFFHYKFSTTTISNSTADEGRNHSFLFRSNSKQQQTPTKCLWLGLWWARLPLLF